MKKAGYSYHEVRLENKLRVMMISTNKDGEASERVEVEENRDKNSDKSMAFLNVGVGFLSDPHDLPGTCHLDEHVLFRGSKQYPGTVEFDNFLQRWGGESNGETLPENTSFNFNVDTEHFKEALERFSDMIKNPLIRDDDIYHERLMLQSEWALRKREEKHLFDHFLMFMVKDGHPLSGFGWGNATSLIDVPKVKGIDVPAMARKFFLEHYSSDIMTLGLLSSKSLKELEQYARDFFSDIPVIQGAGSHTTGIGYESYDKSSMPIDMQKFSRSYTVKSPNFSTFLFVSWALKPDIQKMRSCDPLGFLAYTLGFGGKGSLINLLMEKGLAYEIHVWDINGDITTDGFTPLTVLFELTKRGANNKWDVIKYLFSAIRLLKKLDEDSCREVWNQRLIEDKSFSGNDDNDNKDDDDDDDDDDDEEKERHLADVVMTSRKYPDIKFLDERKDFNFDDITSVIDSLTSDSMNVLLMSPDVTEIGKLDTLSGFTYTDEENPARMVEEVRLIDTNPYLVLPTPSPYKDKSADIILHNPEYNNIVEKFVSTANKKNFPYVLYYHTEESYTSTDSVIRLSVHCNEIGGSPLQHSLTDIYYSALQIVLHEQVYFARLSSVETRMKLDDHGISIELFGHAKKLLQYIVDVCDVVSNFILDEDIFQIAKQLVEEKYRSLLSYPAQLSNDRLSYLFNHKSWFCEDTLDLLRHLRLSDVRQLLSVMQEKSTLVFLIMGNIAQVNAKQLVISLSDQLKLCATPHSRNECRQPLSPLPYPSTVFRCGIDKRCRKEKKQFNEEENSFVQNLYVNDKTHNGEKFLQNYVCMNVIVLILDRYGDAILRNVFGVGYESLIYFINEFPDFVAASISCPSTKLTANEIDSYIDLFVKHIKNVVIVEMSEEEFETYKEQVIEDTERGNLLTDAAFFWNEIMKGTEYLGKQRELGKAINSVTLDTFQDWALESFLEETKKGEFCGIMVSIQIDGNVQKERKEDEPNDPQDRPDDNDDDKNDDDNDDDDKNDDKTDDKNEAEEDDNAMEEDVDDEDDDDDHNDDDDDDTPQQKKPRNAAGSVNNLQAPAQLSNTLDGRPMQPDESSHQEFNGGGLKEDDGPVSMSEGRGGEGGKWAESHTSQPGDYCECDCVKPSLEFQLHIVSSGCTVSSDYHCDGGAGDHGGNQHDHEEPVYDPYGGVYHENLPYRDHASGTEFQPSTGSEESHVSHHSEAGESVYDPYGGFYLEEAKKYDCVEPGKEFQPHVVSSGYVANTDCHSGGGSSDGGHHHGSDHHDDRHHGGDHHNGEHHDGEHHGGEHHGGEHHGDVGDNVEPVYDPYGGLYCEIPPFEDQVPGTEFQSYTGCGRDVSHEDGHDANHEGGIKSYGDACSAHNTVMLKMLGEEAERLTDIHPDQSDEIRQKQAKIEKNWKKLASKTVAGTSALEDSYYLHRFLSDYRDLIAWIHDMKTVISADELAKDVAGAEALLEKLKKQKDEIEDAHEDSFRRTVETGQKLLDPKHNNLEEVKEKLKTLANEKISLMDLWEERRIMYEQCMDLQLFYRDMEQADASMSQKEAFLANDDLGDSLDSVEALMKKYDDFEKSLAAQKGKIKALDEFMTKLVEGGHYASGEIAARRDARCNALYAKAEQRKRLLQESHKFQTFERDYDEIKIWINEKLKAASDEGYLDPTNLQGKLQKHESFTSELSANQSYIETVTQQGRDLISQDYNKDYIRERVDELLLLWEQLLEQSDRMGSKLEEANDQQQFNRNVEDIEVWLGEIEGQLMSEDFGKDLTGVQNLQKKHTLLECDVSARKDRVDGITQAANQLVEEGNFDAGAIQSKQAQLTERYQSLQDPMHGRRLKLRDALRLQQFFRDIEDEEDWIREKESIATSTNRGRDLIGVQNLIKKHQALNTEISDHEARIGSVCAQGDQMIKDGHFATDEITRRTQELLDKWNNLKEYVYEGEYNENNQRHGHGQARFKNGDNYVGEYANGKRNGNGLYVFANGATYDGQWVMGKKTGEGLFIYPDGTNYQGGWLDDQRSDHGVYHYSNGDVYEGEWKNHLRHGHGKYTYAASKLQYNGEWSEGMRVGEGEVTQLTDEQVAGVNNSGASV